MRSCVALQTCLALLLALLLAPLQHVHTGPDHDHDGVIHAHFYSIPALPAAGHGPQLTDPDDDHASARSLDTFTLVIGSSLAPFALSRGPDLRFAASQAFAPIAVVEERGNSPPARDRSIPRAPPC
ncbi:MAG: hypothetical protein JO307_03290 [Bryobacterales bacterium]|nr:hypothetical protein [Bryobacterales bacterium]